MESDIREKAQADEDSGDLAEDKPARPPAPAHPVDQGDEEKADYPDHNGSIEMRLFGCESDGNLVDCDRECGAQDRDGRFASSKRSFLPS